MLGAAHNLADFLEEQGEMYEAEETRNMVRIRDRVDELDIESCMGELYIGRRSGARVVQRLVRGH
jgi:hypothetical protein